VQLVLDPRTSLRIADSSILVLVPGHTGLLRQPTRR
jgi:hypothetical protein